MTKEQIKKLMDAGVLTHVIDPSKLADFSLEDLIARGYLTHADKRNWEEILTDNSEVIEVVDESTPVEPAPVVEEESEPVVEEEKEPEIVVDEGEDEE